MEFIQIQVQERGERGTAAMHRLRRVGSVPGVLYGLGRRNLPLTIPAGELERFIRTGSHLVELRMGDQTREAILREVQQDPLTDAILHVDFQRVEKGAEVEDHVPVTYRGIAPGTSEGGLFQSLMDHLRVRARPRDLPDEIVLDLRNLHVGDAIYVRDVSLPDGVTLVDSPDDLVAHVVLMRGRHAAIEEEEGAEEESAAEPEVIGKEEESPPAAEKG